MQLEQRFVDASQLLRSQVAVVHGVEDTILFGEGERAHGLQQPPVRQLRRREVRHRLERPEETTKRRQGQPRTPLVPAQPFHDEPERAIEVGVRPAAAALRQPPQVRRRIPALVALPGGGVRVRVEQESPVLGRKQEEEAVHEAQHLAIVVLRRERAGPQPLPQPCVRRVREEAATEGRDRRLHAAAQPVEGARPALARRREPPLEDALLGLLPLHPRLVADEPEEDEVGVDLALHHGLEVEFDVGLAREAGAVAQDAEAQTIRDEGPEVRLAAVEEFLHQPMRADSGRARDAGRAVVQVHAAADEMDRHLPPLVRDRVGLPVHREPLGRREAAVAQLREEGEEPALPRQPQRRVALGELRAGGAEGRPGGRDEVPAAVDRLGDADSAREVVRVGGQCGHVAVARRDAGEEFGGEESPLAADGGEEVAPRAPGPAHVGPPPPATGR